MFLRKFANIEQVAKGSREDFYVKQSLSSITIMRLQTGSSSPDHPKEENFPPIEKRGFLR